MLDQVLFYKLTTYHGLSRTGKFNDLFMQQHMSKIKEPYLMFDILFIYHINAIYLFIYKLTGWGWDEVGFTLLYFGSLKFSQQLNASVCV